MARENNIDDSFSYGPKHFCMLEAISFATVFLEGLAVDDTEEM
jgi:hypothetical protein